MYINYPRLLKYQADDGAPFTGEPAQAENQPPEPEPAPDENNANSELLDKLQRQANWASAEYRKAQAQNAELQQRLAELESKQKKAEKFDAEAATKTIQELRGQLDGERKARKDEQIEREVRNALGDKIADGCWDYFWTTKKSEFDIVELEGKSVVRKAATPYAELGEFVAEIPEVFLKPTQTKGAGDPKTGPVGDTPGALPANWGSLDQEQKTEWFRANPDFKL